jgi:hypothetical protein
MKLSLLSVAAVSALVLSASAHAAMLIPVTMTGSTGVSVFGINNNNVIAGSWVDSASVEHGLCGPLGIGYSSFDYAGNTAVGTEARGINDSDQVVGFGPTDGTGSYVVGPEFEYNCDTRAMTTIVEGNTPLDGIAQGIEIKGTFAGDHFVASGTGYTRFGYTGKNGQWLQDFLVFGTTRTAARGVNKSGVIVGYYGDTNGAAHGFILQGGVATRIDFPNATELDTFLEGINDHGVVTGDWDDGVNPAQGFTYDTTTRTFTSISVPGSTTQVPWGINNAGLIALSTDQGAFIYCPLKPKQCPAGGNAVANGKTIRVSQETLHQDVLKPASVKNAASSKEPMAWPARNGRWLP